MPQHLHQQQQQHSRSSRQQPEMTSNLRSLAGTFAAKSLYSIGYLTGEQVIRDLNRIDPSSLEKFYQKGIRLNYDADFESPNNDVKPNQFIDPFSPDLFKDEIIDIDFGAIDAFTSALNAQLNAEKSDHPAPQNLQFPSHILTSNHAAFIDNQLLLGDSSVNAGDGSSGINVQFISSSKDFNQSNSNLNGSIFRDEGGYSRSNSFGSIIDIQSQSYATSQATRPTRSLVIDNVPNELAGLINLEDLNSAINKVSADLGNRQPNEQLSQAKLINVLQDIVRSRQQRAGNQQQPPQQQQQQQIPTNNFNTTNHSNSKIYATNNSNNQYVIHR